MNSKILAVAAVITAMVGGSVNSSAHAVTVVAPVAAITAAAAAVTASNAAIAANNAARAARQAQEAERQKQEDGFNLERVPSIELNCTGLGSVVFWTTGELEGDNVQADYVDRVGNTLFFTNGVKLSGVLAGDALLFDTSTMKVHGKEYTCSGE